MCNPITYNQQVAPIGCMLNMTADEDVIGSIIKYVYSPLYLQIFQALMAPAVETSWGAWVMACLRNIAKTPSPWPTAHKGNLKLAWASALAIWLPPGLARWVIMSTTL